MFVLCPKGFSLHEETVYVKCEFLRTWHLLWYTFSSFNQRINMIPILFSKTS